MISATGNQGSDQCPENESNLWQKYWDSYTEQFIDTEEATDIQVTCVNQDNKNNLQLNNDRWLESMTEKEVFDLIQTSSTQELCGRRPWTNVENHQKIFPDGNPQGYSGLPIGPQPHKVSPLTSDVY